jgi:2-dehydropantoate 2-reductase
MEFTIVGAGAIGAIIGCHLAASGHGVEFIETNEPHIEAIKTSGLRLSGAADLVLNPKVSRPGEMRGPLTNVLLAVKARHTEDAMAPIAPLLAKDGFVVSLQNGLEEYKIADRVGAARTVGASLTFGGHYRAPGDVVYGGPASFRIGELDGSITPRLHALQAAFSALQPVEITGNIFGFLWAKMALGAVYFGTALVSADVPDIYARADYRVMLGGLAGEVVRVAEAGGVCVEALDGFDPKVFRLDGPQDPAAIQASWDGQRHYWSRHTGGRTGIWRDLAQHHRPTEVNEQVGSVVSIARSRGIAVPRLEALAVLIHAAEAGRPLGWENLDELTALDRSLRT